MFRTLSRNALRSVLAAGTVLLSLLATFSLRFVLVGPTNIGPIGSSYASYIESSLFALGDSLWPSIVTGTIALGVYSFLSGHSSVKQGGAVRFLAGWIGFSLFFVLLALYLAAYGKEEPVTSPFLTLLPAWAGCLIISYVFWASRVIGSKSPVRRYARPLLYSRGAQLVIDASVVIVACCASYFVRFDGTPPVEYMRQCVLVLPYLIVLQLGVNHLWGVNSFIWRFTGIREAIVLGLSVATSGMILLLLRIFVLRGYDLFRIPFGVLLVFPVIVFLGFLSVRSLRRMQANYASQVSDLTDNRSVRRVILIGAGNAGAHLVRELRGRSSFEFVGFLDDDPNKQQRVIHGVRVLGTTRQLKSVFEDRAFDEAIFCMPSAPRRAIERILADCEALGLRSSSVPSLSDILLGKTSLTSLRPVRMEELLGRDAIVFSGDDSQLTSTYRGKVVLITGAAGSIGSEIVRQVAAFKPLRIIMLDKDENGLFEVGGDVREEYSGEIKEVVANIRDRRRLESVFARYQPQVVLHAAAYKHVPMMEHHPSEAIFNNVIGTSNVVETAAGLGAGLFLLISTDKAVNPTNIMGASKRVAEMVVRRQASISPKMRCCCVRFGNVLGSRASVVPHFQKRIAQGKDIQVTHEEMRRYFMTIPEAVQLVLQASSLAVRSETFVLDMGDPVKIMDLARNLIEQSGLEVGKDIKIRVTGLRPGEKLYEELLIDADNGTRSTKYPKIFVDPPLDRDPGYVQGIVERLAAAAEAEDRDAICEIFEKLGIGYRRQVVPLQRAEGKGP